MTSNHKDTSIDGLAAVREIDALTRTVKRLIEERDKARRELAWERERRETEWRRAREVLRQRDEQRDRATAAEMRVAALEAKSNTGRVR